MLLTPRHPKVVAQGPRFLFVLCARPGEHAPKSRMSRGGERSRVENVGEGV
jgi:hypothetical protein